MLLYILDSNHNIVECPDTAIWSDFISCLDNKVVKKELIGETEVSTVFLGIDHSYGSDEFPVLFETMVFGPLDPDHNIQERCHSWDEALIQHERIVNQLKETANVAS